MPRCCAARRWARAWRSSARAASALTWPNIWCRPGDSPTLNPALWRREWGVGDPALTRGGLRPKARSPSRPRAQVTLLQRKAEKPGSRPWQDDRLDSPRRLAGKGVVRMLGGVNYRSASRPRASGHQRRRAAQDPRLIAVDTVVLCAGQDRERGLADALGGGRGRDPCHRRRRSWRAELDAKRAIDQGARLAARL